MLLLLNPATNTIPPFSDLFLKVLCQNYRKEAKFLEQQELNMVFPKKNKFYPRSTAQPVLPLLPESLPSSEETKQAFITMELYTKAGEKGKEAQTYKKAIRRFKEGSCQEWIEFLDNITEVFKQNSISEPSDKIAVIRSVLGGDSRSSFDVALEDLQIAPKEGETEPKLTEEMIEFALEAVAITIFPKKALTTQKRWMQHELKNL